MIETKAGEAPKILVVEDEIIVAKDIKKSLENVGYTVNGIADSGELAIEKAALTRPNVVLMDIRLKGDMDGVQAAQEIWNRFNIPVVYLTANSDISTLQRAKATAPFGYVTKPFKQKELHTAVEIAVHRHQLETKLKQREQWLDTILSSIGDAVLATDNQNRITLLNPAAEALTGWKQEDALGRTSTEVFHIVNEETRTRLELPVTKALQSGVNVAIPEQTILIAKNGAEIPIDASAAPIKDDKGNIAGAVLVFRDISERKRHQEALRQANNKLTGWVNELEQRNREITLLAHMSDVLQACLTVEEAHSAIAALVQPLFPHASGGVFLLNNSKHLLEAVTTWGTPLASEEVFAPNECWAMRRGRCHFVENTHSSLSCNHLHPNKLPTPSLCVPMMAQGTALGILSLNSHEPGQLLADRQQLAVAVAEHLALALANIKLRETLKNQSIRDPLTGLFNRRYMEESLERELSRCQRKQEPLSIVMIDVDHFKRFNDTFGHEAGDAVLRKLGQFLQSHIRGSDMACRYGGEELTLILPEASLEVTQKRAEQIREGVKHLNVRHHGQPLGAITLSLGVASFPEHGLSGEAVIQAADAALYRAKKLGRDTVRIAS
jgi:diguanylate cyclase (GGDEF)-like protein/PAS domain S-box-containing protein